MVAPDAGDITGKPGTPRASICHGAWILIEADALTGRTLTSYPCPRTDLRNAGAVWVDEDVVVDEGCYNGQTA